MSQNLTSLKKLIGRWFGIGLLVCFIQFEAKSEDLTSVGSEPKSENSLDLEARSSTISQTSELSELSEAQIPVALTDTQIKKTENSPWLRMVWGSAAFVFILIMGWFAIKKFRFANLTKKSAIPMKLVQQFHLAPKRSLVVMEVAGEYLMLGVTDHSINLIKTLSLLDEDLEKQDSSSVFEKVFNEKRPEDEEFEIASAKDLFGFRGASAKVSFSSKKTRLIE